MPGPSKFRFGIKVARNSIARHQRLWNLDGRQDCTKVCGQTNWRYLNAGDMFWGANRDVK